MKNTILHGNSLELLKTLEDNTVDSIVTDPPYELGFMGKKWDSTGIAYNIELWKECYRVLKHGGYLLAFSGSRTYHRMAVAIEDAGFNIKDCIEWVYGSGFPKGQNISKGIDKLKGVKGEQGELKYKNGKTAGGDRIQQLKGGIECFEYIVASEEAKQWEGWNTQLKPSHEPICVAQKPISEKNIALNILKWGVGAMNIGGCRMKTEDNLIRKNKKTNIFGNIKEGEILLGEISQELGRYPANIIFDTESGQVLDKQSGHLKSGNAKIGIGKNKGSKINLGGGIITSCYGDEGGASRYFYNADYIEEDITPFYYCSKASSKERGEFNLHPTVKPIKLIKYLIKLVTPPNGVCLDIFEGSGTHAVSCLELTKEDYPVYYIGMEMTDEYIDIINKRIERHSKD